MMITRLQLENFKIFYGKNTVMFEPGKDNVTVIEGDNGHGKTTIMESIFWALYGKEKRHDKLVSPKYSKMINNHAKAESDFSCAVTINFDHDGKHYFLQRGLRSRRRRGTPTTNKHFIEEVMFRINGREEKDHEPIINEIFPQDIASFFFFDGETISRFADTYTSNKETIEKALGLPYLKRAKEDMVKIRKEIEKNLRGVRVSPKIEKLEKDIQVKEKRREDKDRMLKITEKILANLNTERGKLKRVLDEFEELKVIHERIQDLEEFGHEIDKEDEALKEKEDGLKAAIPNLVVKGLLRNAVEDIGRIKERSITDRIDQGRLMDQKEFLEHLVATGICLCGSEFTETTLGQLQGMVDNLKAQLEGIHPVQTDRFAWTQGDIADALFRAKILEREMVNLPRLEAKRTYIENNRKRIERSLAHEHKNLDAHSAKNRREKEVFDRLTKITQDRAIYRTKRSELKDEVEAIERGQLDLEMQLRKQLERQNLDTLKISREIDLIDRVLNAFSDIIERSAETKRRKIEKKGSKIFHEITNKPKEFVGLDIDEDNFEVKVRRSDGSLVNMKRLSDGEKHIVALSFLGGIKESTSEGTLIMDSPFGRLDQTHKSRLVARIGDLAQHIFLLVTDEDLDPSDIKGMKGVQRHYSLNYDQMAKYTTIMDLSADPSAPVSHEGHLEGIMTMLQRPPDLDMDESPDGGV